MHSPASPSQTVALTLSGSSTNNASGNREGSDCKQLQRLLRLSKEKNWLFHGARGSNSSATGMPPSSPTGSVPSLAPSSSSSQSAGAAAAEPKANAKNSPPPKGMLSKSFRQLGKHIGAGVKGGFGDLDVDHTHSLDGSDIARAAASMGESFERAAASASEAMGESVEKAAESLGDSFVRASKPFAASARIAAIAFAVGFSVTSVSFLIIAIAYAFKR